MNDNTYDGSATVGAAQKASQEVSGERAHVASAGVLLILDDMTGAEIQRCAGPSPDGSCTRVAIGDILPCAGHALMPARAAVGAQPYGVSGQATLCPVTVAAALAIPPDTMLILDE